jgi:hypothetical protein
MKITVFWGVSSQIGTKISEEYVVTCKYTYARAHTHRASNTAAVIFLCPYSLCMLDEVTQQNKGCVFCVVCAEPI